MDASEAKEKPQPAIHDTQDVVDTDNSTPAPERDTPSPQLAASPTTPLHSKGHAFANALKTWTEIDLPSLQKRLDDQGIELREDLKASLLSRKELAAKTKEFRKLGDQEKLEQFTSLLKLYQKEIDGLATKKKAAEGYFFGIYRLIAEAPDPRPLLEVSLEAVADYSEVETLRLQLSKLQEELSKRADYEQLKQRLLRMEQKSAELVSSQLHAQELELKAVSDERERNFEQKIALLEKDYLDARKKIEELRTDNEVLELQGKNLDKSTTGQTSSNLSTVAMVELEIARRDAESSKKRIFELEQRNEKLRRDLLKTQNALESDALKQEYTTKTSQLEGENALLTANLENIRRKFDILTTKSINEAESLTKQVTLLQGECQRVKIQLDKMADYEELKEEIKLMKQIEFGEVTELSETEGSETEDRATKSVDLALVLRNKHLTLELAELRSQHDGLVKEISSLKSQVESSNSELSRAQLLNDKLEKDLAEVQDSNGGFNDNASMVSKMTIGRRPGAIGGSIVGSIISGGSVTGGGSQVQDDSTILPIITKQRDRFRDRNNELEEELRKQYAQQSEFKRQVNQLRRDNEELYERTRYLAQYKRNESVGGSGTSMGRRLEPKPNIDKDLENPYATQYELKLHPLEQFRIREQERINLRLLPIERLFILFSRAILATRTTRLLFVLYCVGLHFVVFSTSIYVMSLHLHLTPEVGKNVSTGGVAGI